MQATTQTLVILDPIYAWFDEIEETSKAVTHAYDFLRELKKTFGCAVLGVHHVRKEAEKPELKRLALDALPDSRKWFNRARGSSALINGCDIRIAFDLPSHAGDCKLICGGYARMTGALPLLRLTRDLDADGDPRGYRRLSGIGLLKADYQAAYDKLPEGDFRFKDVQPLFRGGKDATTKFLRACVEADVLEHDRSVKPKGAYRKKTAAVEPVKEAA